MSKRSCFDSLRRVRLHLFENQEQTRAAQAPSILFEANGVSVQFVRNHRARRYILRVRRGNVVRVTIPWGGTTDYALQFAEKHKEWIRRELQRLDAEAQRPRHWTDGSEFLFRGELVRIASEISGDLKVVRFGDQSLALPRKTDDYRPSIEQYLWSLADKELPIRTLHLASLHGLKVARVAIRSQRSRWGSCSRRRTISLNWRLIQAPPFVSDYLILHELMHLREMNHSARFWDQVARACPDYVRAEAWLNQHSRLLRDGR